MQSLGTTLNSRIDNLDAKLSGRIDALDAKLSGRIDSLEGRSAGLEAKMDAEFRAVHSEVRRIDESFEGLSKRLDMNERLLSVEARVRELEAKR